jgi:hypothetical protein
MQILGAWIGNNTNMETPWELVLDKIPKSLNYHSKSFPTLKERKIIAQTVIGGCTQFLIKAQGMLGEIESAIVQILRNFIWEENTLPWIALDYLHRSPDKGGLNLINISARNAAIELVWLKEYLNLLLTRPGWAKITDIIIDAIVL